MFVLSVVGTRKTVKRLGLSEEKMKRACQPDLVTIQVVVVLSPHQTRAPSTEELQTMLSEASRKVPMGAEIGSLHDGALSRMQSAMDLRPRFPLYMRS